MSTGSQPFHGPLARLLDALKPMPPLKWEAHDVKTAGWEGKPDPEQWAVVQWMAKNVRPELLAQQAFKALRVAGLIEVGKDGEVRVFSFEQKKQIAEARRRMAAETRAEREEQRKQEKLAKKKGGRPTSYADFVKWLSGYAAKRGEWPVVEDLVVYVQTDPDGPKLEISRMTIFRYRARAEAEGIVRGRKEKKYVRLNPGPKFPPELMPAAPVDDDPAL